MSKIRIGIIGLGNIAQKVYLPYLSAERNWKFVGGFSPTESKRSQLCGMYRIKSFSSITDLLQETDAVFVSSSTESHFEIVTEALTHGKDVYVDKPLAATGDETEQLTELSLRCGRKLMVGFNRRFAPMYVKAKNILNTGTAIIRLEKHRTDSIRPENYQLTMLDDYIHLVDTARWLAEPKKGAIINGALKTNENLGLIFAQHGYQSENGSSVFLSMHRKAGTNMERMELITEGALVRVRDLDTFETETGGTTETVTPPAWETILKRKGFEDAILHFINSVEGNTQPLVNGEEALKTQRLLETMIKTGNA
ncbi:Gfo/Idh/MocA family protein [Caproiciproducens faecalis]|uniref:Gfo/Idh/MocA family oxidoreductase n=1 Tax=Caproiciproducens faecalis TaxID=2820301 RepID=A0ABS7DQR8_9FIRM|nr:Gfo/Idh/MocA family oxidoreductase [Caproiciproducens faecalis]MBW7573627.1 Gfo/Idh/MocA family oxidoreductase [Caproiciproducens faecalis]